MRSYTIVPALAGLVGTAKATFFPGLIGHLGAGIGIGAGFKGGIHGGLDIDLGAGISLDGGLGLEVGAGFTAGVCDLGGSWNNHHLFHGEIGGGLNLDLALLRGQCSGGISIVPLDGFLESPCLRVGLGGFSAYVEVDLNASGAGYHSVQLIASPEVSIGLGGLSEAELKAAFGLDLLVGAGAAIDCTAGFYVTFSDKDFIDLSIATKEVLQTSLTGMVVTGLPLYVGAGVDLSAGIGLDLGLRLRSQVHLGAGLELGGDIDLGKDGASVSIWTELCSYHLNIGESDKCACDVGSDFGFHVGLGLHGGLSAGFNILDFGFSPSLDIKLGGTDKDNICMPDRGQKPSLPEQPTSVPSDWVTSTVTNTNTYTVTSCLASIPNCPADKTSVIVTSTVEATTTVCPATQTPGSGDNNGGDSAVSPIQTPTGGVTVAPCQPSVSSIDDASPTDGGCDKCENNAEVSKGSDSSATQDAASSTATGDKKGAAGVVRVGMALALPIIAAAMM